jgi:hypothetical protein
MSKKETTVEENPALAGIALVRANAKALARDEKEPKEKENTSAANSQKKK